MRSMHIAKGQLWLSDGAGGSARAIESTFAREVRLFHRNDFQTLGFDYGAAADRIVLSRRHDDGTACLEIYDPEGNCKGVVTGGDCIDAAPSFVPAQRTVVVFQSAGVARHPQ